ncbi:hypothetical protein ACT3CD_04155 [Geofilum sp. OHC36d9]|uniref:hypothetical protein n=1 Tax=Geofilum sp. OHC36d9 TaxID=3458413 RepID=UPI004034585E
MADKIAVVGFKSGFLICTQELVEKEPALNYAVKRMGIIRASGKKGLFIPGQSDWAASGFLCSFFL